MLVVVSNSARFLNLSYGPMPVSSSKKYFPTRGDFYNNGLEG
jgi:hypothetical protein